MAAHPAKTGKLADACVVAHIAVHATYYCARTGGDVGIWRFGTSFTIFKMNITDTPPGHLHGGTYL